MTSSLLQRRCTRALLLACVGLAHSISLAQVPRRLVSFVPDCPLVAVRLILPAGSQYDPPGKEGLAALTAALVSEGGTKELTYDQILEKFYPIAGDLSSLCLREYAVFWGVIHRDNLDEYGKLFSSMLVEPRFASEDFERLKNQALDALTKSLRGNNDEALGKAVMQLAIYGGSHPYGHVTAGTVEGLKSITLDDVRAFHSAHYSRTSIQTGIAGGVDLAQVPSPWLAGLESLPSQPFRAPDLPSVRPPDGCNVVIVQKPADATAISIGFPLDVTRRDDDFYPLFLANSYLGEHRTFNGKLMQHLRRDRGLNYGDYSYVEEFIQDGPTMLPIPNDARRQQFFSIWVRPVPHDKAAFALRAALFELNKLVTDGISPEDFEATRNFLLNYSNMWTQTLERRLGYDMEGPLYGRESLGAEMRERLPTMTIEQVNTAVRKHLKPSGIHVAIVTQEAEGLKKLLASGEPTPLKYDTEGTPAKILEEDKLIERLPIEGLSVRIIPASALFETPGLPAPERPATHTTTAQADYYTDSPAQMRPADGKVEKGTAAALIKREGNYARVQFRAKPDAQPIEAWVAIDVLEELPRK